MAAPDARTLRILPSFRSNKGERFYADADGYDSIWKDPQSIEDVTIDWSRHLGSDTISTSAWATSGGVTLSGAASTTTTATVTLSGDPGGGYSEVTNTIVTAAGLKFERTIRAYSRES